MKQLFFIIYSDYKAVSYSLKFGIQEVQILAPQHIKYCTFVKLCLFYSGWVCVLLDDK